MKHLYRLDFEGVAEDGQVRLPHSVEFSCDWRGEARGHVKRIKQGYSKIKNVTLWNMGLEVEL